MRISPIFNLIKRKCSVVQIDWLIDGWLTEVKLSPQINSPSHAAVRSFVCSSVWIESSQLKSYYMIGVHPEEP